MHPDCILPRRFRLAAVPVGLSVPPLSFVAGQPPASLPPRLRFPEPFISGCDGEADVSDGAVFFVAVLRDV